MADMTPVRWQAIEALFNQLADIPPTERPSILASVDPTLRAEVESLLANASPETGLVANRISALAESLETQQEADWANRRIGPYRVSRQIGAGGMGAVLLASRDDDEFRQQVAIKLIRRGMDTAQALTRFRQERQILARLEHPYIARLFDGGRTADGLPYLVMEFIDGEPITDWCARAHRTIDERITLFRKVCAGVQFAHQNLVVHRDLKPANILVAADGTPKLLDFGIAKLLDEDDESPGLTATGVRLLTPDYASPEQVRGEPITTATDIYSLGAVLFELLTGKKPHRLQGHSSLEIEKAICMDETPRPSAVTANAAARRELQGDLDTIILRAMSKEPTRRYASAEQLSEDLRRYLEGRPVQAQPDTFRYRTGKFLRRNRAPVLAAALVFLSLSAGIAYATYQANLARQRFQQVRTLANTFLFDFHDDIQNIPGTTKARERLVRTARDYLDSLTSQAGNDPQLLTELATAYIRVANIQGRPKQPNLGQPAAALESYSKAIGVLEQLTARNRSDRGRLRLLGEAYSLDADLREFTSDRKRAVEELLKAIAISDEFAARPPVSVAEYQQATQAHSSMADIRLAENKVQDALVGYRKAIDFTRAAAALDPSVDNRRALAKALDRLADGIQPTGDLLGALDLYKQEEVIVEALHRENPENVRDKRALLIFCQNIGNLYGTVDIANLMQPEKALAYYRKMLVLAEEMFAADLNDFTARADLFRALQKVANLTRESDPQAALAKMQRSLDLQSKLPEGTEKTYYRAATLADLAAVYTRSRSFPEARRCLRESEELIRNVVSSTAGSSPPDEALGVVYARKGELAMAERAWPQALADLTKALQVAEKEVREAPGNLINTYDLADSEERLARMFEAKGDGAEAYQWQRKRLDLWKRWNQTYIVNPYSLAQERLAASAAARLEKNVVTR